MIEKPAITEQKIENVIAERWSGRAYDPLTAVSTEDVASLCEAARWAPSCFGDQPWRFVVWNKFTDEKSWQQAIDCLAEGNQAWAKNAPVLVLAASVNTFTHNGSDNRWVGYDTGAASISLCLQATSLGLMSHQMGGFDSTKDERHHLDLAQHFRVRFERHAIRIPPPPEAGHRVPTERPSACPSWHHPLMGRYRCR